MGSTEVMINLFTIVKRKSESVINQTVKFIISKLSSIEREFNSIWPFIDSIEGFLVSPVQEHWLFKIVKLLPDGANIVEIGSFKGRSTCCMAFGCKGTTKHVFAIDSFEGNDIDFHHRDFFDEFTYNLKKCGLSSYVTPIRGKSKEIATGWNKPIHLLFIDGSHQYEDILADFSGFFSFVVPGGIVAVHDVVETWPGPLKAWHDHFKHQLEEVGYCSTIGYGSKPDLGLPVK